MHFLSLPYVLQSQALLHFLVFSPKYYLMNLNLPSEVESALVLWPRVLTDIKRFQWSSWAACGTHSRCGRGTRSVEKGDPALTRNGSAPSGVVPWLSVRTLQSRHCSTGTGWRGGMVRDGVAGLPSSRSVLFTNCCFRYSVSPKSDPDVNKKEGKITPPPHMAGGRSCNISP